METVEVPDPRDLTYPFDRTMYDHDQVLYHGTWSTWSESIDLHGFEIGNLPFDWEATARVAAAWARVGRILTRLHGLSTGTALAKKNRRDIHFAGHFWVARAYATDPGGETIRMTLEEAADFRDFSQSMERRTSMRHRWEEGLRSNPSHELTLRAVETLRDDQAMRTLATEVEGVERRLRAAVDGGYPVVYAVLVEPAWFGDRWRDPLDRRPGDLVADNLSCPVAIKPERLLGKAAYIRGIESDFAPAGRPTWEEAKRLGEE